ncbi:unnamed protein product, partial [Closterium sp. NIES-54]
MMSPGRRREWHQYKPLHYHIVSSPPLLSPPPDRRGRQYDESKETERVARRARRFAEEQEELEALSREEWDAVKAARPQTPYESALTRSGARIRTGSWPSMGEAYSWASVVLADAMKRAECGDNSR